MAGAKGSGSTQAGAASTIVSPRANRFLKAETNCYLTHVSVDAKNHFHISDEPTEAWISQRFADRRLLTPFLVSGIRALVAGLVLVGGGTKPDPRGNRLARRHRFPLVEALDAST